MSYLLLLAILPVFLLCFFIYKKDANREPGKLLAKIFALGFFSAIPVVIGEMFLGKFFPTDGITNFLQIFVNVFISVALVEEGFKWLITKFVGYNNKEFDEVYDIIVYSVFASLGFACIENILYVIGGGVSTAILRALLSVPGHMCFGVIMGYFLSQAKVNQVNGNYSIYTRNILFSILFPTLAHTIYDAILFYTVATSSILGILVFFVFDIIMVVLCFITVSKTSKIQKNISDNVSTGVISLDNNGILTYTTEVKKKINYCPVCGHYVKEYNYCPGCGFKIK